jgi:hypothetical protein
MELDSAESLIPSVVRSLQTLVIFTITATVYERASSDFGECLMPRKTRSLLRYPLEINPAGSDTPRNQISQGIKPLGMASKLEFLCKLYAE